MKTLLFSTPSYSFFKEEDKVSKKLGRGRNFLRKSVGETKMEQDFFIFIFSLLALMITDTAFWKSCSRKLFLEKLVTGTSKNWPYQTDLLVFCSKI